MASGTARDELADVRDFRIGSTTPHGKVIAVDYDPLTQQWVFEIQNQETRKQMTLQEITG